MPDPTVILHQDPCPECGQFSLVLIGDTLLSDENEYMTWRCEGAPHAPQTFYETPRGVLCLRPGEAVEAAYKDAQDEAEWTEL